MAKHRAAGREVHFELDEVRSGQDKERVPRRQGGTQWGDRVHAFGEGDCEDLILGADLRPDLVLDPSDDNETI